MAFYSRNVRKRSVATHGSAARAVAVVESSETIESTHSQNRRSIMRSACALLDIDDDDEHAAIKGRREIKTNYHSRGGHGGATNQVLQRCKCPAQCLREEHRLAS